MKKTFKELPREKRLEILVQLARKALKKYEFFIKIRELTQKMDEELNSGNI